MKDSIYYTKNSDTLYILIHGYTGSATDFNGFPEYLYENHDVDVRVPLLIGHGAKIEDLDDLGFDDFVEQLDDVLVESRKKYKKIIIGGLSWGAILSLYLASKYPVDGVLNVNLPMKLRFPLNIPGLYHVAKYKKYWPKVFKQEYFDNSQEDSHYEKMHVNALRLVKEGRKRLKGTIENIKAPVFSLHSVHDRVGSYKSLKLLEKKLRTRHQVILFTENYHNVFYVENDQELYAVLARYFTEPKKKSHTKKISAIVPAYNEEKHIGEVLTTLSRTDILDEVIVVDDNSSDRTGEIARSFPEVRYFRNPINGGKAISMQRGVEQSNADIVFFCDADLKGLSPEMVKTIVRPVLSGEYDMYIGLRNNVFQKMFKIFALNSGERAINRELWEMIPSVFKHRYRIETAMNYYVARYGRGYESRRFDYYQTLKEKKYGVLKGDFLRWWMYFDVLSAYILILYYEAKNYLNNYRGVINNKFIWRHKH